MSENTTRPRQPLLRDESQKMIAGVCTGMGHHFDVDPVVFRILFAVLTFFGGLGILAYAACWLIIPAHGARDSEAQRLLTGPNVYVAAGAAALMVLGLLWFTDILANRFDQSLPLVLAGAAAIGVVIWRRENHGTPKDPEDRHAGPTGDSIPGAHFPQTQPQTWWQRPVTDHYQSSAEKSDEPTSPEPFTARSAASEIPEPKDRIESAGSEAIPEPSDAEADNAAAADSNETTP